MSAAIRSIGIYVPERQVPNQYFETIPDTSDERTSSRTGTLCTTAKPTTMIKRKFLTGLMLLFVTTSVINGACQPASAGKADKKANAPVIRPGFQKYFKECQVNGAIVIYDNAKARWIVSDTVATKKATQPASTFKVINLLIALETQTIPDENYIVKWPGWTDTAKYGYRPDIYHDISVKEAFEVSAGWAFVELAKKIGRDRYKKYLTACGYGNGNLSEKDADFWNFGPFAISPQNQVAFLKKVYDGNLPFSKRNLDILKKVMVTDTHPGYTIRSKTGWTRDKGINTGWWVGYITTKDNVYFFATRLLQDRKNNRADFGSCRKEITLAVLRDLAIIP
ncbi:penicillin-binding transpeptidase domain-containing protein [Niabella drilacis]|uniref:beta-lactamase n=1 Tax=Niabella drilacis (strain DSM 25811 / CCM 8410 / CCUG 62505 / LMG 26954 / E90) TaxID=1285928 RepID=A0A1G6X1Z8_NIADE|nr:penicillin-binding transpeptidase domain-containing protein [Niabella drilacis]SDD71336.1 beta-lactamase class D [Niabella drilacis]